MEAAREIVDRTISEWFADHPEKNADATLYSNSFSNRLAQALQINTEGAKGNTMNLIKGIFEESVTKYAKEFLASKQGQKEIKRAIEKKLIYYIRESDLEDLLTRSGRVRLNQKLTGAIEKGFGL